ncbi:DNA polymerase III subunit beta [Achromobacter xylosoxidans]|uniref:Beta sliding clamp n=1 Tax=Alcaligenes xylosoxydans xylosoxydans TaxID=85698 RepID=A0A9X3KUZ0_ALCXX|nr:MULTISPECIES: DNA polymerase III subunit beta [Achromobacter]KMJ89953.1 DNA polymerase III subunit beta [Achromobacter xylosoxidans]KOQ22152.1 DNA polymerase III subunit beta [Achromobacter xylosoxidans]KOQ25308.1 DNA polymerase III subunit beta [Achromobacter xylosoxidans]KOQ29620.1 DNA polymerase III subunit beta [Achromobacter xylosoxidans]KOQ40282.1 DNA polymerase III subunit beta [Achromobacter xylosoxidans]
MQLVQTTRDALLKPLSTVAGIVERRHTLPILANILMRKEGNKVAFIATDLEVQITTHADFGVGHDNESTTVAARKLLDILKALPDTGDVRLALASNKLSVQSAKSRFALQTLAASEFPTVAQPEQWDVSLSMPQRTLRHLFNMVHFAMAQQDIRYYLNGMLLVFEPGRVRAVATDGHRLAHCSTEADGISERHEVIVPRKTVLEMQRLLEDSDEPVSIDVAPGQIRFRFGDVELVSKLVEGKFPDFTRVIPTNYTRHFLVGREALQGSLQRAAILTTDKFKGVRLQLAQNQMKISSSNAEQEEAQEEIDIDYGHEPLDVGFNVGYLLDVLSNVKVDNIQWSVMPDANASALITLPEDDQFKYVVMPMRI